MAEPTQSAEQLQLGQLPRAAATFPATPTTYPTTTSDETGSFGELNLVRKRGLLKSPVRENCTPGSVRGRSGDWTSYRDGHLVKHYTREKHK